MFADYVSLNEHDCQELYALIRNHVQRVQRKNVTMQKMIGSGSFGEVFSGTLTLDAVDPRFVVVFVHAFDIVCFLIS